MASFTRIAEADILAANLLIKTGSGATLCDVCGADDTPIGISVRVCRIGEVATIEPLEDEIVTLTASEAIAFGDKVELAAGGKVAVYDSGTLIGKAVSAAVADGPVSVSVAASVIYELSSFSGAVSISPAGGEFEGSQEVTLTAPEGYSIRYTTNGTDPTATTGTLYSTPFTLTDDATVKAVCFAAGEISSATFENTGAVLSHVWRTSTNVVAAAPWDETDSGVVSVVTDKSPNGVIDFDAIGTCATSSISAPTTPSLTALTSANDTCFGVLTAYRGRLGGNHVGSCIKLTKTSHGLTSADIGKRFQDTGTDQYAITGVPDGNTLYLVQKRKSATNEAGYCQFTIAAGTLTALDGQGDISGWTQATQDTDIVVTANVTHTITADGVALDIGDSVTGAARVDIVEEYDTIDIAEAFDYFVATGASSTWAGFAASANGIGWHNTFRYTLRASPLGGISLETEYDLSLNWSHNGRFNNVCGCQAFHPTVGSRHRWLIIPNGSSKTLSGTWNGATNPTIDPKGWIEWNATQSADAMWNNSATNITSTPVDWTTAVLNDSGSNHTAWDVAGDIILDPSYEEGIPANRLTVSSSSDNALEIAPTTQKVYPYGGQSNTARTPGWNVTFRWVRAWHPPYGDAPDDHYYTLNEVGASGSTYTLIHAHAVTSGGKIITVPASLVGKSVATARTGLNSTLSTTTVGSDREIAWTATDANAHIVLKLT